MNFGIIVVTLLVIVSYSPPMCSGQSVTRRRRHVWANWSPWSPCTRSCGTGITSRTRDCLNSKHRPVRKRVAQCEGPRVETKVCNRKPCPPGAPEDYTRQCAKFNGQLLAGRAYTWIPFHRVGEECVLNCRAVGHRFYARLKPKLEDGTPCGRDKVCFSGRCLSGFCDSRHSRSSKSDHCESSSIRFSVPKHMINDTKRRASWIKPLRSHTTATATATTAVVSSRINLQVQFKGPEKNVVLIGTIQYTGSRL